MIEFIGILAGCIVLTSFIFKTQKMIRFVNLFGCVLFIIYGILIKSFSIIFLNSSTLLINIYYLSMRKLNE